MIRIALAVIAGLALVISGAVGAQTAFDAARPNRSPYCVSGLDFNGNGIIDIGDLSFGFNLLWTGFGKPVENCPPLPAPHVWCDPADARGVFCCEPFDPARHVVPWLDADGVPLPPDLQKPAACLPGEPLAVGEIPPAE